MPALTHNDAQTNKQTIKYRQVRYLIYKWSGGCISVTVLGIYYNYYGYYLNVFYKYSLSRSPANIYLFTHCCRRRCEKAQTLFLVCIDFVPRNVQSRCAFSEDVK